MSKQLLTTAEAMVESAGTLQAEYERYFYPQSNAVKSGDSHAAFVIYSAFDYSIPVNFSSNSIAR